MLNRSVGSIGVVSNRFATVQLIILPEKAAINIGAFDFEHKVIGNIGSKLDVALACPKYLVQAVVGLYGHHVAMVPKIRRQSVEPELRMNCLRVMSKMSAISL
jgi:hypothetical protein